MPPTILIEGIGDVTTDVITGEGATNFAISANGQSEVSQIVLRDIGPVVRTFTAGKRVTAHVEVPGGVDVVFAGYLGAVSRQFWYDVDRPDTLNRRWVLSCIDINWLFNKRFAFKKADPTVVPSPIYLAPTYDDTIIAELIANWLDLSADDLDTSSLVNRVAIVNPSVSCITGQAFQPWEASDSWGSAMDSIAQVPGAIYALLPGQPLGTSPFGRLMYADVDTGTAPYVLSDRPDLDGGPGYRECTIFDDATDLVNDDLAWGFGKGVNHPVFDRISSSSSIATHGIWQAAQTLFDVWCKDTIDAVADSVVFGSPSSHRGQKDDLRLVELTANLPIASGISGFKVAQKARFISHEYGVDEILPIRHLELDFPAGSDARYKLKLGHAYDRWGFSNPPPPVRSPRSGGSSLFQPCVGGSAVIDDFNRTVSGFGTASSGGVYVFEGTEALDSFVDGDKGRFQITASPPNQRVNWQLPTPSTAQGMAGGEFELSYVWQVPPESAVTSFGPNYFGYLSVTYPGARTAAVQLSLGSVQAVLRVGTNSSDDLIGSNIIGGIPHIQNAFPFFSTAFVPGDVWHIKLGLSLLGDWVGGKVWKDGDTEPAYQNQIGPMADFGTYVGPTSTIRSFQQPTIGMGYITGSGFWDDLIEGCADATPGGQTVQVGTCGNPGDNVAERPVRLSSTQYRTTCAYQPGSLRVYRNGILQRLLTDVIQTNSTGGLFDLTDPTTTADDVRVEYVSEGSSSV